jgi:hypothetical protein
VCTDRRQNAKPSPEGITPATMNVDKFNNLAHLSPNLSLQTIAFQWVAMYGAQIAVRSNAKQHSLKSTFTQMDASPWSQLKLSSQD